MTRATALYHTFGCKLNYAETATIAEMLEAKGIVTVSPHEHPDIIVINTCSVTELADKKCRHSIRMMSRRHPDAAIVVTGCYAQLKPEEASSLPGVVIVAGNDRKTALAGYIERWLNDRTNGTVITPAKDIKEFTPSCSSGTRTRYFLKVQDGCDYYCSYCTIPYARGRSRSGTIEQMMKSAEEVASRGGREIVLTGVNVGDFGKLNGESFFDLIKALDAVEGIERYRISSIEPNLLTDEIIDWVASSRRFMPHFHIPLQAGSDEVLKLMRRRYDTSLFASKIKHIRNVMPDAFIGVDLITGARGETQELFEKSKEFVDGLDISRLHVFPYSERPGTQALNISPVVPQKDKQERARQMIALSTAKLVEFTNRFAGSVRPVLIEGTVQDDGTMEGFTDNYIRVSVNADESLANSIVRVRLDGAISADDEPLKGVVVQ